MDVNHADYVSELLVSWSLVDWICYLLVTFKALYGMINDERQLRGADDYRHASLWFLFLWLNDC